MIKDKVVVVGVSAVGKSTFARKLTEKTGLPLVHMDALMWKPGWEYVGDEATAEAIAEYSSAPEWIIEGYITKAAQSDLFAKADTVILLDYPGYLAAWRYIKRCWQYRRDPRPELPDSPDTFSFKMLTVILGKGEVHELEKHIKEKREIEEKIIRLCSPKAAEDFLETL